MTTAEALRAAGFAEVLVHTLTMNFGPVPENVPEAVRKTVRKTVR